MAKKPKAASQEQLDKAEREEPVWHPGQFNPARVFIDSRGRAHPWVCEENAAMWLGGADDE